MGIEAALARAAEEGMDLVEIAPQAKPPVCRIMDWGRYRFEQSKKAQAARKRQKQIQVKEVKFRPGTDDHDYEVKMRNLRRFIEEGNKVRSEEHTSELQSRGHLVCRLLLEKKKTQGHNHADPNPRVWHR